MQRTLAVITLGLLACVSCRRELKYSADSPQREHVSAQASKPAFELSPYQQQILRAHGMTLRLGTRRSSAITLMGPFDREDLLGPKKGLTWKCRALVYYVVKFGQTPNEFKDRKVELIFNRGDALVDIISNVDGIASRGDWSDCR